MYRNCSLAESQILEVLHLENYYHQNWCPYHLHSSLPPQKKGSPPWTAVNFWIKKKDASKIWKTKRSRKHKNQNSRNHFLSTSRKFLDVFFPRCFPRFFHLTLFPWKTLQVEVEDLEVAPEIWGPDDPAVTFWSRNVWSVTKNRLNLLKGHLTI